MKKFLTVVLSLILVFSLFGCANAPEEKEEAELNIGVLKGPTGMGAVTLMEESENGTYEHYSVTLTAEPTDIVARLSNGSLDIGALPTNTAANLYNKTNGGVKIIAVNCLGVLYILENGNSVTTPADLKGRTICCNGQGANPEFVINYVLRQNGLEPGKDVEVVFMDAGEIATGMISGEIDLCMLPVPAATTVCMKNKDVRAAISMTEAFADAAQDGSALTMGCLVATAECIEQHPEEVRLFLERYAASVEKTLADPDASAELVAKYEIAGSAAIAKAALPDAGIVCYTGADVRKALEGYLQVLFDADPKSVGGGMPGDDFYYEG